MKFGTSQFSAIALGITATFHAIAALFAHAGWFIASAAVAYALLGFLVYRNPGKMVWVWLAFIMTAGGIGISIYCIPGPNGWAYWGTLLGDILASTSLGWYIWKRP